MVVVVKVLVVRSHMKEYSSFEDVKHLMRDENLDHLRDAHVLTTVFVLCSISSWLLGTFVLFSTEVRGDDGCL